MANSKLLAGRIMLFLATLVFFGGVALVIFGTFNFGGRFGGHFETTRNLLLGFAGVWFGYHWLGGTLVRMEWN